MMRSMIMGTSSLIIRNLNSYDQMIFNGNQIQSVRWKRKPIWLPTAKSKMFRIPKRPVVPADEANELKRLFDKYNTLTKSLAIFYSKRHKEEANKILDPKVIKANNEKDFENCTFINDLWNKEVAAAREERLTKERTNRMEEIARKLKEREERNIQMQEMIDNQIRQAKLESSTFITKENIDNAIEDALNTIVDHNAAIDLQGNFYKGDISKKSGTTNVANEIVE